jgi:hypothetical protein
MLIWGIRRLEVGADSCGLLQGLGWWEMRGLREKSCFVLALLFNFVWCDLLCLFEMFVELFAMKTPFLSKRTIPCNAIEVLNHPLLVS